MKWLYGRRIFGSGMMAEKPVRRLIEETAAYLAKGIERGIEEEQPSEAMIDSLRESVGVFSGFKTFHEMKEASGLLLDENGILKPFEQFSNDVQKINDAYNKHYLRTEYAFAVRSAEAAAHWEDQQDDGDGRYLLQYRTAGDSKVRPAHRALNGITLPASDPFWDKYTPPNSWNCRCQTVKVRAAKYPATDSEEASEAGEKATEGKYAEMFRFNPGKQRAVYPAYNSYTIRKCSTCKNNGLQLAKVPSNELCAACPIIREQAKFIPEHTEKGELRVHLAHGKNERAENIRIARYFTDRYDQEIDLLPKNDTEKCADAYNRTLKQLQEYKQNITPTRNAVDSALRDANRKADHAVLLISSGISEDDLTRGIKGRMLRVDRLQSATIMKDGKDVVYTKEQILQDGFKASWTDLK